VLAAVRQDARVPQCASEELKNDTELMRLAGSGDEAR